MDRMIKILITGGNGYIAKSLYNAFKDTYEVTSISRNNFDLSSFNSLNKYGAIETLNLLERSSPGNAIEKRRKTSWTP